MGRRLILVGVFLLSAAACQNSAVDYTLLIGEWVQRGECNRLRHVFTPDDRYPWLKNGRYLVVENVNGKWVTQYDGVYLTVPVGDLKGHGVREKGAIMIADVAQQDAYLIHIQTLTNSRYRGYWDANPDAPLVMTFKNPKDAFFDYARCPARGG